MACSSCGRRARRIQYGGTTAPTTVEPVPETLSAARLTPHGWVKTCVVCGQVSEPSPFADTIPQSCDCKRNA
ncbi:hypothetical protein YOLOSWAG_232 [Erwinia phage vB_EamM_Yoloswag]|uniref:Uncharacterized protein n=1 Tax=Erwinia phage vB_EamM_Yoloswag TaxID=1958956 RepID=A0A1S6L3F9_9CAUD|nr:hypothetical protein HOR66_gp232 [Erwinia phage vB_EamM_Yoloswag]AQT28710.1 hypothetical protein YOLOSWAG_232 [Erwinia phage vB_EamM_Yoloswag]